MHVIKSKINGQPGWCLDARKEGKGRKFFATKAAADEALSEMATGRKIHGEEWESLSFDKKVELISVNMEIIKAGLTIRKVWDAYKSRPQSEVSKTISDVIAETVASKNAAGRRLDYVNGLRDYLKAFARGRESNLISSFGVAEIEEWFVSRNEKPATRKSNLGRLSAMFDLAWRRNYISENPCWRIELVSITKEAPKILTLEQAKSSLDFTLNKQPDFLAWLILTLFVGLRPEAEADAIDWAQIDLSRNRIRVDGAGTKVRQHRIIELSLCPVAIEWLKLAKKSGAPLKIRIGTRKKMLRRLRDHLGFKRWPQDILRHTAASNLLAIHQDAGKVAGFLGNSAGTLLKDYKALIVKEDAEKFMALSPPKQSRRIAKC